MDRNASSKFICPGRAGVVVKADVVAGADAAATVVAFPAVGALVVIPGVHVPCYNPVYTAMSGHYDNACDDTS